MSDGPALFSRPLDITRIVITIFGWMIVASFFAPDLFYYPFRAFGPGPHGVYGTWTGIVRTIPSERRGTPMTFAAQDAAATNANLPSATPSFAVVKLTLRPPIFSTLPKFFWRPSYELTGTVDVYLPDGTHQHCTHQFGGFPNPDQLQLMIYDSGKDMDAIAEAEVSSAGLQFSSGMCPVREGSSVSFAGTLTRGSSASVAALQAQLPAYIIADRNQVAAQAANFAREWVGNISAYNPDYKPAADTPNTVMRLRFIPEGSTPGAFTGQGEFHQAGGLTETFTLQSATLHDQAFEASAKFHDTSDEFSIYNGSGSLSGTAVGDTLTITQGGEMLLGITGILHPGTDADFTHALAVLNKTKPGRTSSY